MVGRTADTVGIGELKIRTLFEIKRKHYLSLYLVLFLTKWVRPGRVRVHPPVFVTVGCPLTNLHNHSSRTTMFVSKLENGLISVANRASMPRIGQFTLL